MEMAKQDSVTSLIGRVYVNPEPLNIELLNGYKFINNTTPMTGSQKNCFDF